MALPYQDTKDLPKSVRNSLPQHAQEIFKEAFNNAYDEYKDPDDRKGNSSQEETAFKVAWAAVKQSYHKVKSGKWEKK
jgi:cation transport regulator